MIVYELISLLICVERCVSDKTCSTAVFVVEDLITMLAVEGRDVWVSSKLEIDYIQIFLLCY